ncbi:Fc.00g024500.m01.CDS01 [Cosmosporella sp. VM-42]
MAVNLGPSDGFDTIKTAPTHKESLETMREVEQLAMQSIAASDLPGPETVEGWAGLPTYPPETPIKKGIVSAILRTIHNIPPCVWVTNLHVDDITVVVSRYRPSRLLTGVEVNVSPSGGGLGFSTTAYPGPATKKTLAPQDQDPAASTAVFPLETQQRVSGLFPEGHASDEELRKFIFLVIKSADVLELERFLNDSRLDIVTSTGINPERQDWSALHVAVHSKSLDVFDSLLKLGCDTHIAAADGRTPVHLCRKDEDEDALRTLVQSGGSTVIPDGNGDTIWHIGARESSVRILKVLLELDEREQALHMVSYSNETPICAALAGGLQYSSFLIVNQESFGRAQNQP